MNFKIKCYESKISDNYDTLIKTPEAVMDFIKDEFDYNEKMLLIGMNIKNKIIIKKDIAIGSYNQLMSTPADIFIPCLMANARNFILVHNHPSEDITPSKEDIIFTKKVEKAADIVGLNFVDHLIVNSEVSETYSFKNNGIL